MTQSVQSITLYSIKYVFAIIIIILFAICPSIGKTDAEGNRNAFYYLCIILFLLCLVGICTAIEIFFLDSMYFANSQVVIQPSSIDLSKYSLDTSQYNPSIILNEKLPNELLSGSTIIDLCSILNPLLSEYNLYLTNKTTFKNTQLTINNLEFDSSTLSNLQNQLSTLMNKNLPNIPQNFINLNKNLLESINNYLSDSIVTIPVINYRLNSILNTDSNQIIYTPFSIIFPNNIYFSEYNTMNPIIINNEFLSLSPPIIPGKNTNMPIAQNGTDFLNLKYIKFSDSNFLYNNNIKIKIYNKTLAITDNMNNIRLVMQEGSFITNSIPLVNDSTNSTTKPINIPTVLDFISTAGTNKITYTLNAKNNNQYNININNNTVTKNQIIKQTYATTFGNAYLYCLSFSASILSVFQLNLTININADRLNININPGLYNQMVLIDNQDGNYIIILQYSGYYKILGFSKVNNVWQNTCTLSSSSQ